MKKWIVVCRTGKEYTLYHAAVQRRQFFRHAGAALDRGWEFICLTDIPNKPWHHRLVSTNPGWWALMEMFRFQGPNILTGLDTVLLGDLDPLMRFAEETPPDVLFGIRDFFHPRKWASGVTLWNGDWSALFEMCGPEEMRQFRGDQDFIEAAVLAGRIPGGKLGYLQDHPAGQGIISFKAHVIRRKWGRPRETHNVCCFHGRPRPWEVAPHYPWLRDALNTPRHHATRDFVFAEGSD